MASGSLSTPSRETQVSPPDPASSLLIQLFLQLANTAGGGGGLSLVRGQLLCPAALDASHSETKAFGGQVTIGMPEFVISGVLMACLTWSFAVYERLENREGQSHLGMAVNARWCLDSSDSRWGQK